MNELRDVAMPVLPAAARPLTAAAVSLRIDRLVLHGLPIRTGDGARLQSAFEREIAHLNATEPMVTPLAARGARPSLRLDAIAAGGDRDPERLGQAAAAALWRELGR